MFRIRNLVEAHRTDIAALLTAEHGKVPSDALGEIARGLENLEFACGIAAACSRAASPSRSSGGVDVYQIRQPLGVVAGITPVQLPGDGPDVDVRDGDRERQHVHPQAVREGPVGVELPGRAARRGRRAGRRLQRRPRRQGRGRRDPRAPRHRGRVVRRVDADRPLHLRDRHQGTASASRRSAAPRTT